VEVAAGSKKGASEKEDRELNKIFTTMEFTPDGTELLVGQRDGKVQVIDPTSGKYKKLTQPLKVSEEKSPAIKHLVVSEDGSYFATSDAHRGVCLFKKDHVIGQADKDKEWIFNGKILSHEIEITGLCFGQSLDENDQVLHRLFSIGADRRCFEYNIKEAKLHVSLPVLKCFDIELEAKPTACIWYPQLEFKEGLILTANDEYKMKLWNPTLPNSRRTCLGPTYGGEIVKLKLLNVQERKSKFLVYSTNKKVIGLIKLPLDGNPNKTMGLIAHPDEVTDICCTADGKYIFTCGGDDLAVNMWTVDVTPIEQAIAVGGEGIEPFINLIEGGREGQTFQDMNDFFYYSIIRAKKENTTKTRKLDDKQVPID
jgi:WD40 repeat protein